MRKTDEEERAEAIALLNGEGGGVVEEEVEEIPLPEDKVSTENIHGGKVTGFEALWPTDLVLPFRGNEFRNPRGEDEFHTPEFEEIKCSIAEVGILEPLLVKPPDRKSGCVDLVNGEMRLRSAQTLGLKFVPVRFDSNLDSESKRFVKSFTINFCRKAMSAVNTAKAIKQMLEMPDYNVKRIARMVGKSEPWVYSLLNLLEVDDKIHEAAERGEVSKAIVQNLAQFNPEDQPKVLARLVEKGQAKKVDPQKAARMVRQAKEETGVVAKPPKRLRDDRSRNSAEMLAKELRQALKRAQGSLTEFLALPPEERKKIGGDVLLEIESLLEGDKTGGIIAQAKELLEKIHHEI